MDPWGLMGIFITLDTHQETFLVTFCDPNAKIGVSFWTHGKGNGTDRQTDLIVEIVI